MGERRFTEFFAIREWQYTVDTWLIHDFDRIFLGTHDFVNDPSIWKSHDYWILVLGKEFYMYVQYMHYFFLSTRSLYTTWLWVEYLEYIEFSQFGGNLNVEPWEDVEDYDEEPDDDDIMFDWYLTFAHDYGNENNPIMIWDIIFFDLLYFLFYFSLVKPRKLILNFLSQCDITFIKSSRYKFRVSTTLNFIFFLKNTFKSASSWFFLNQKKLKNTRKRFKFNKIKGVFSNFNWLNSVYTKKNKPDYKYIALVKPIVFDNLKNFNYVACLLRKQKVYTKSKYARSRQYCKNIVLFGLMLNIILMYGLNSSYYAILINTGYFIYLVYLFMVLYSVFVFFKYRLYNIKKC